VLKAGFNIWLYAFLVNIVLSVFLTVTLLVTGLISPNASLLTFIIWMLLLLPIQWYVLGWSSFKILKPKGAIKK
jgi:ABC-type multidrug transport system permease subunit